VYDQRSSCNSRRTVFCPRWSPKPGEIGHAHFPGSAHPAHLGRRYDPRLSLQSGRCAGRDLPRRLHLGYDWNQSDYTGALVSGPRSGIRSFRLFRAWRFQWSVRRRLHRALVSRGAGGAGSVDHGSTNSGRFVDGRVADVVDRTRSTGAHRWVAGYGLRRVRERLRRERVISLPSPYGEPYIIALHLIEEAAAHRLLNRTELPIHCPVRLIHGMHDADAPWSVSIQVAEKLTSPDTRVILVKDGEHTLSREPDLRLLTRTLGEMLDGR